MNYLQENFEPKQPLKDDFTVEKKFGRWIKIWAKSDRWIMILPLEKHPNRWIKPIQGIKCIIVRGVGDGRDLGRWITRKKAAKNGQKIDDLSPKCCRKIDNFPPYPSIF